MNESDLFTREQPVNPELIRIKAYGMFLGGAVGDAFGMPIEGWNRAQITKYVGELREIVDPQEFYLRTYSEREIEDDFPHKYATRGLPKGSYTDDTYLTLMVGNGIAKGGKLSLGYVAAEHVRMFAEIEADKKDTWDSFGRTTTEAIKNLAQGVSPYNSGVASPTPGNGPAIKMGPVGLYMFATGKYDEGLTFAERVGRMTHQSNDSVASGIAQANGVYELLSGAGREEFVFSMLDAVKRFEYGNRIPNSMSEKLLWVKNNMNATDDDAYDKFGSKFSVLSNYPLTVFMVQKYWDKPFEGLIKTVNLGGDSDSIGAMYGTLMGSKHGVFMPNGWVEAIRDKEPLQLLSKSLSTVR